MGVPVARAPKWPPPPFLPVPRYVHGEPPAPAGPEAIGAGARRRLPADLEAATVAAHPGRHGLDDRDGAARLAPALDVARADRDRRLVDRAARAGRAGGRPPGRRPA